MGVVDVGWRDGELRRIPEGGEPALSWVVGLPRLEEVATEPWGFLAQPGRLAFAWFPGPAVPLPSEPAEGALAPPIEPAPAVR